MRGGMMNGKLRLGLMVAAALAAVSIGGLVLVAVFINPNDYKPQIEAAVLKATGRQLVLGGDLSLSVFPTIHIEAGPAELKDDPSFGQESFLRLEKASASVRLFPLLRGKVEIGAVAVSGVRLNLAVNKEGKANWVMSPPDAEKPAQNAPAETGSAGGTAGPDLTAVALESLKVTDTRVSYTDMRTGQNMEFTIARLVLGPVKVGQKTALDLEAVYAGALARPVSIALSASFVLPASFAEETVFDLSGKADRTEFSFNGRASTPDSRGRRMLSLSGDLAVGDLDLDAYTAASAGGSPKAREQAARPASAERAGSGDEPVRDLLNSLFLDVRVQVNSVTVAKVSVSDIRATMKNDQGMFAAKPVSMNIAGGPLTVEASADARQQTLRLHTAGNWKDAEIQSLLRSLAGREHAAGNLNLDWDVNGTGLDWPVLSRSLAGSASMVLTEGVIRAFTLIPSGLPGLPAFTTDIEQIHCSATWAIADGVATNNDLNIRAANMAAQGGGRINIPDQTIDYRLVVDLPLIRDLPDLRTLPVLISGSLSSPEYRIDEAALLRDAARNVLSPGGKVGKKVQKGVGRALDKLFR